MSSRRLRVVRSGRAELEIWRGSPEEELVILVRSVTPVGEEDHADDDGRQDDDPDPSPAPVSRNAQRSADTFASGISPRSAARCG